MGLRLSSQPSTAQAEHSTACAAPHIKLPARLSSLHSPNWDASALNSLPPAGCSRHILHSGCNGWVLRGEVLGATQNPSVFQALKHN
jgi:hypothetical protein